MNDQNLTYINWLEMFSAAGIGPIVIAVNKHIFKCFILIVCQAKGESGQLNLLLFADDLSLGKHVKFHEFSDTSADEPATDCDGHEDRDKPDECKNAAFGLKTD